MTIQTEAEQASSRLQEGKLIVGLATESMDEFVKVYQNSIKGSRTSFSVTNELFHFLEKQTESIQEAQKAEAELEKNLHVLGKSGQEGSAAIIQILEQSNQLTTDSDRLTRLLSRQYTGLKHCEQVLDSGHQMLENVGQNLNSAAESSSVLKNDLKNISNYKSEKSYAGFYFDIQKSLLSLNTSKEILDQLRYSFGYSDEEVKEDSDEKPRSEGAGRSTDPVTSTTEMLAEAQEEKPEDGLDFFEDSRVKAGSEEQNAG